MFELFLKKLKLPHKGFPVLNVIKENEDCFDIERKV